MKQNAKRKLKVGAACQAGLAVYLIAGLAATHLPACLCACLQSVPNLEEPVIS